jgi:methionyl-tRNA formyltransferase
LNAERPVRVVFMGTPAFAIPVLAALLGAGHDVAGVFTRPDRPAGRGKRPTAPAVKAYGEDQGLPVFQPASLRPTRALDSLASLSPDLIVVAAYGLYLPAGMLELPPLGALNIHPSLLPKYRGPSPVASAILEGASVTGVTIMKIDEDMDSGAVVASRETPIGPDENAEELTARLFHEGASLLVEVLPRWAQGQIQAQPQDDSQATVTKRLSKEDGEIDWQLDANAIERQVRAYQPWPGSFTRWSGRLLKIVEAVAVEREIEEESGPGLVVVLPSGTVAIACGEGALEVSQLQLEGRKPVGALDFVQGHTDFVGSTLG